jgi:2-polyprenyl-6-methoxyphenol hydroxylase-like FAD-dependent oxidoreductase
MFRIAVVGAGIAGTAAALALARAGHHVDLFERAPALGPVGAGLLLQPSGQAALADLGILGAVLPRSEPISELRAEQVSGRILIRLPYADADPAARGYGVSRGLLFSSLLDACVSAGVEIHTGSAIRRHVIRPAGLFLESAESPGMGPFDFAVAADGGRSALRASSGIAHSIREYGFGALWTIGRCSAVRGYLFQLVQGTRVLVGLLPLGDGRASFFWGLRPEDLPGLRASGFAAFRERVLAICPRAAEIFEAFQSFEQAAFATYQHVVCRRWHDDRLVLLGDAAHAMSPHLGQGANLALADAAAFARHLAATGDFRIAAQRFEAERRPHARAYQRLSWFLTPFFQSGSRILGWGRDVALPLFTRLPPLRRLMSRTLAGRLRAPAVGARPPGPV